jgi:hypothetical protein
MSFMNVPSNIGRRTQPIYADGGNQVGNYRVHIYTQQGTFEPFGEGLVDILVVGGGGGADVGGAGAGGFREFTNVIVTPQIYAIDIGAGGSMPGPGVGSSTNGNSTTFADENGAILYESSGGGAQEASYVGSTGASGGGGFNGSIGGVGNIGGYTPVEGYNGSGGWAGGESGSGGAGGGGGGGANPNNTTAYSQRNGGPGRDNAYTGSSVGYAGGGGGGSWGHPQAPAAPGGSATHGGGTGHGGGGTGPNASRGWPNTGGGAGGGYGVDTTGARTLPDGQGGSGIVVIRYLYEQ